MLDARRTQLLALKSALSEFRYLSGSPLANAGAEVELANNGKEALEKYIEAQSKNSPFQIIVSDMQMPITDGYKLVEQLKKNGEKVKIIALTAHAMESDREKCISLGCDAYLSKPIDREILVKLCKIQP